MKILLDLDEVLVQWVQSVADLYNVGHFQLLSRWEPGVWGIQHALGVPEKDIWDRLKGREEFWSSLPKHRWFDDLIKIVEVHDKDWHIVTSPSWCESCYAGKVKWLKREFGEQFNRFAITPHKELFARPNTVLIDDREETVNKFSAAGGLGILFPAHHNRLHEFAHCPMRLNYIRERLGTFDSILRQQEREALKNYPLSAEEP